MKLCFLTALIFFFFNLNYALSNQSNLKPSKTSSNSTEKVKSSSHGGEDSGGGIKIKTDIKKNPKNLTSFHALLGFNDDRISADINFLCVESFDESSEKVELRYLKPNCNSKSCDFFEDTLTLLKGELVNLCSKQHTENGFCQAFEGGAAFVNSDADFSFILPEKGSVKINLCSSFKL